MSPGVESQARSERPVEVDAARLLLVLYRFALEPTEQTRQLGCWPEHPVSRVFAPEYYLQKLDFLVRYPAYLAYELIELHRLGIPSAVDAEEVKRDVRLMLREREPELRTHPFRRFWRGAYESLDRVEAWWYARGLVYTHPERRGEEGSPARPRKYFFVSPAGEDVAERLIQEVDHAQWYDRRIRLVHRYFGALDPAEVKALQYSHPPYREAQLNEFIPDLSLEEVEGHFLGVFHERWSSDE